jgi:hypothetical protein
MVTPLAPDSREEQDEGKAISQKALRQVQDHPSSWGGADHLREPAAQAATGLTAVIVLADGLDPERIDREGIQEETQWLVLQA